MQVEQMRNTSSLQLVHSYEPVQYHIGTIHITKVYNQTPSPCEQFCVIYNTGMFTHYLIWMNVWQAPIGESSLTLALRKGHTRKPVAVDGYACLFVCMSTKCIHIELVMDMTTDSFLAALRRFVARRGRPAKFITDNGSNFVGARNRLTQVYNMLDSSPVNESLSQFMVDERSSNCYIFRHGTV